jgi:hypothetical protein
MLPDPAPLAPSIGSQMLPDASPQSTGLPSPRQSTPPHLASVADILAVNGKKGVAADL